MHLQNCALLQQIGTFEILKKLWYCFYIRKIAKSLYHLHICSLGKFVIFYDGTMDKTLIWYHRFSKAWFSVTLNKIIVGDSNYFYWFYTLQWSMRLITEYRFPSRTIHMLILFHWANPVFTWPSNPLTVRFSLFQSFFFN